MPPARKGLQDIKTHAGRATAPGSSHRTYIRLSTLEMERQRRQHEYEAAQARADAAKSRVERLESEIREIIAAIGEGRPVAPPASAGPDPALVSIKHAYGPRPVAQAPVAPATAANSTKGDVR